MDRDLPLPLSRNRRRANIRRRRGVAAVEAAVLLPLALMLMLGTWEVGRMVEVSQILNNAAREGGRSASTGQYTNSQVQQTVLNYLMNAGLPSASATVRLSAGFVPKCEARGISCVFRQRNHSADTLASASARKASTMLLTVADAFGLGSGFGFGPSFISCRA